MNRVPFDLNKGVNFCQRQLQIEMRKEEKSSHKQEAIVRIEIHGID